MNMNSKDFFGGGGRLRALLALFPLFAASAYALPEALVSAHAAGCRPLGVHGEHGEQFDGLAAGVAEASPCSCELTPGVVLELRSIRLHSCLGPEHPKGVQDALGFCVELAVVNHTNRDVTMTTESTMVRPFTLATCRLLRVGDGAEVTPERYPFEGNSGQYSCRIAPGACHGGEVYSPDYRLAELDDRFVFEVSGTLAIDASARPYRLRVPVCPSELLRSAETLCAAVRGGMCGACRGGDTDTLRVCLAAGADVRGCVDAQGRSLLHLAAEERGAEMAEMLLAAGADADARDGRGYTPLHTAAEYDAAEVVRLLAGAGAELSACTPDHFFTPLHLAAWLGNTEAVRALLAAGAPVNACREEGGRGSATPLHLAAAWGHADIVALLLDAGADARARVLFGSERLTPLDCARRSGRDGCRDCERMLRDAGAEEDGSGTDGSKTE